MNTENYITSIRKYVGHAPILTIGDWLLVINEKEEVLMQLRTDFNSWDFPGETMELGETIEAVAKRELKEETNLDVDDIKIIDVFSGKDTYRKYPNGDELYVVSVLCEIRKFHGDLLINDGESKILKWFKKDEIPENLSPVAKKYIDKIKEYLN